MSKSIIGSLVLLAVLGLFVSSIQGSRPTLPDKFRVTIAFTAPLWNFTFSGQEYYDGNNQEFRVDVSEDSTRKENLWKLKKKRFYDINRSKRTCKVYNSDTYDAPGFSPKKGSSEFFSPAELFRYDEHYMLVGTERVRGILCERYEKAVTNDPWGGDTFNGTHTLFFSVPQWTFMGKNMSRIPIRSESNGLITANNTHEVQSLELYIDYTDFNNDVPDDVFQVPAFCIDDTEIRPLPNFETGSFIASLEVTHRNNKSVAYVDEYWDIPNQKARFNNRAEGKISTTIVLGAKKQMFKMTNDRKTCTKETLKSTNFTESAGLLSVQELFEFDTRYDHVYLGQVQVRGMISDHFRAVQTIHGINYTVEHFFSAEEWNVDGNESEILPTRVIVVGKDASGAVVDMSIDVVNYVDIVPDPQMFEIPGSCPGYLIFAKSVAPTHAAGVGFLCLFIGLFVGAVAGAFVAWLIFVKQICARFTKKGASTASRGSADYESSRFDDD